MDQLLAHSKIAIDRPRAPSTRAIQKMVYPLDYGYLEGTSAMDGEGVDVWVGTSCKWPGRSPLRGGLAEKRGGGQAASPVYGRGKQLALQFQSQPPHMLALLVRRKETPSKRIAQKAALRNEGVKF